MQIKEKKGMGFSHSSELMTRPKNKIAIIVTVVSSADRMVTVHVKPFVSSPPCYHHQPGSLSSPTWLPVITTMLSSPTLLRHTHHVIIANLAPCHHHHVIIASMSLICVTCIRAASPTPM